MDQLSFDELFAPVSPLATTEADWANTESAIFDKLRKNIEKAMKAYWIPTEWLLYEEMDAYSAVYLENRSNTLFRIHADGKRPYISIPQRYAQFIPPNVETWTTASESGYIRIALDDAIAESSREMYEQLTDAAIMAYTSDIACCALYKECSDARRCLRADDPEYLGCYYRKNLKAGKIFY